MSRALTSASNISRREMCPGSAFAESLFPEPEDSADSQEGTLLHDLDANPDKDRSGLKGEQLDVLNAAAAGDQDIFNALIGSVGISPEEPFEEGYELEMWFFRSIKKLFPGHCDRWRWYPNLRILVIIDKKFGRKEVTTAEANMQLRTYAVMGAKRWNPEKILVAINQPRLRFEDRASLAEYTEDQISAARDHVLRVWDASHNPDGSPREDAPRIAGDDQCRYCRARLDCDAYRAKYEWLAGPSENGKDAFVGRIAAMNDDELDTVWRAIVFAKLIESSAKGEIVRRNQEGGMLMYELSDTGNTSTINDPVRAMKLLKAEGLTEEEITACAKFGLENLSEKLRLRDRSTMAAAKRKLKGILEPVLDITPRSPSLKRLPTPSALPASSQPLDNVSDTELFPR